MWEFFTTAYGVVAALGWPVLASHTTVGVQPVASSVACITVAALSFAVFSTVGWLQAAYTAFCAVASTLFMAVVRVCADGMNACKPWSVIA